MGGWAMKRKAAINRWPSIRLGDVISLEYGKSLPEQDRRPGPYAVYGSNGLVGRAHTYFVEERSIIVGRKGSAGEINYAEPKSWPIDTTYYVVLKDGRLFSVDYVYYLLKWIDPRRFVDTTTKPGLNRDRLCEQLVPLPPLPVQERIVQILQKADEIRRKRREALELADKILPALFLEMFGDPATNPKGWPVGPLNDLLDPAIERVNPARAFPEEEFTYIEIGSINDFKITAPKRLQGSEAPSRARQVIRTGDVLYSMTRPNLRNIAIVSEEHDRAICSTGFAVLRPKYPQDAAFIFEIVRSGYFTEAVSRLAEGKSLYPAVDEGQVRQFRVMQPPKTARAHFGKVINQLFTVESTSRLEADISNALFASLLSHAFTGELTAEWEAANAEWIAEQQAHYERLPRLLVLALLVQKVKRARQAAAEVLVTALMKYAFLLQMEGSANRRRLYHFVPYHYGPFAKELYTDLEALQREGLVRVESDDEEDKTRITLVDPAKAEEALAALPDDLKEDAATIVETYGDLDHNALLMSVYEKYPGYARKSRLRQRTRRK
jgi:type I restriction enzyme S subunit